MTTAVSTNKKTLKPSDALDGQALEGLLYRMMLIRRFEERCAQSYQQAKIGGFCHLYIGQEATAVGSIAALADEDPVITAYRDHGHALARGMEPRYCMAEMFGKVTGCVKGKGGSMHMFDRAHHLYGGHAIVGGQAPLGVGLAFSVQYQEQPNVVACYMGDGALNQGAVHESMNLAAIWKLPILFVCENNMYSMGTSIERGTSMAHDLSVKAAAYGLHYAECDGQDVLETYNCFKKAADEVRNGGMGYFINAKTYRYKGHSMSDPQKYRSKDEVVEAESQDCINRLVNHLVDRNLLAQERIVDMDKQAKRVALDAVKYAEDSPEPGDAEMFTDVYAQPYGRFEQGELPVMLRDQSRDGTHDNDNDN